MCGGSSLDCQLLCDYPVLMLNQKFWKRAFSGAIVSAFLLLGGPSIFSADSAETNIIRVSNNFLQVGLSVKDGGVLELIDLNSKQNELGDSENRIHLWELEIISRTNRRAVVTRAGKVFSLRKLARGRAWPAFDLGKF